MKLIIAILLLTLSTFSQNTKYKDGTDCSKCDSIKTSYYLSGEILLEKPMINGYMSGSARLYTVDGYIQAEWIYNNDNELIMIEYYKSGNIKALAVTDGLMRWYFPNGKIAGTATYVNGKISGYKKCTDGRLGNENLDCLK